MKACMKTATSEADKEACRHGAAASFATSMGMDISDMSEAEKGMAMDKAAVRGMESAMKSCMEGATTANDRKMCKDSTAKESLATSMGRDMNDISQFELEEYMS